MLGQVAEYIRTNNNDIHSSKNGKIGRWNENSRITICDGSVCMDFYFNGLPLSRWAPRYPSRSQRSNENPRVPTNPNPQSASPPSEPLITVEIMDPSYYGMAITMPGAFAYGPVRPGTVTVIPHADSTTFAGPSMYMPESFNDSIGDFVNWAPDWTFGLTPVGGGGGCGINGCPIEQ